MNDRDALIERVEGLATNVLRLSQFAADLRALISLASPSPTQWPSDVSRIADRLRMAIHMAATTESNSAVVRCDDLEFALKSLGPAQWPEDVVERVKRALLAANVNAHGLEDPDALARAALATFPPPERVKGLVLALDDRPGEGREPYARLTPELLALIEAAKAYASTGGTLLGPAQQLNDTAITYARTQDHPDAG